MDIETALRQQFIVFPCQLDAFTRQKERGGNTRIFTFESPKFRQGSRKFLATSVAKFWHWYERYAGPRHFYELIQEGTPCRPYFDLEYYRKFNGHLDPAATLSAFLDLCREVFAEALGITLTDHSFLLLDSSTDAKFSVHVTVHLPGGKLFPNNVVLKQLVERICTRMAQSRVGMVRTEDKETFLCDAAVYSKNRNFRLYLSSKCGKDAVLRLADYCDFYGGRAAPDWRIFLDSLVVPNEYEKCEVLDASSLVGVSMRSMVRCIGNASTSRQPHELSGLRRNDYVEEVAKGTGPSPFPALDRHLLTFLGRFNANTRIRQWQLLIARTTNSRRIQYELTNCRYCFNIEREHKSQNVYWTVDLQQFFYFQKCFDVECRYFISNRFPLPQGVVSAVKPRVLPVFNEHRRNSMDDSALDRQLIGWLQRENRRRSSVGTSSADVVPTEDSFYDARRDASLVQQLERRRSSRSTRRSKDSFYDTDLDYLLGRIADQEQVAAESEDSFYDLRSDERFKHFRRSDLAKRILLAADDTFGNSGGDVALAAPLTDATPLASCSAIGSRELLIAKTTAHRRDPLPMQGTPTSRQPQVRASQRNNTAEVGSQRIASQPRSSSQISIVAETPPSSPESRYGCGTQRYQQSTFLSAQRAPTRSESIEILEETMVEDNFPPPASCVVNTVAKRSKRRSLHDSVEVLPESPVYRDTLRRPTGIVKKLATACPSTTPVSTTSASNQPPKRARRSMGRRQ